MILRTPPRKKKRGDARPLAHGSPSGGASGDCQQLVIYEDPVVPESTHQPPDHMLCTYQCRQMVKAEFLDALESAEKQVQDYDLKLKVLNDNFCTAEAESKKFRDQLLNTEQELAAARGREQALQEQLMKEVNDSQERLRKQLESFNQLEVKLQNEMNLRKNADSSAASAEERANILEGKLNHLCSDIEREKKQLHNELAELKKESKLSVSRITLDLETMECRCKNAEEESELLKEQLAELNQHLNECLHQKNEAEKKLIGLSFQEVASADNNILVKHLQEELRRCEAEVREARKLKSTHENIELMKEKLLEEKGRRERAEKELLKLPDMQLCMEKLEEELSSWKVIVRDIPGVTCADNIAVKFATLQKEVIDSMTKVSDASARLKEMEVALNAAELREHNAKTEATLAKEKLDLLKSEVQRVEMMLSLVTEEKDQLRDLVNELKKEKDVQPGNETANEAIIQELESALAKKEQCIKELESNLHQQKDGTIRQHNEIKLLNEKLENEARRIKSLEREGDRLRSEISLLECKLGQGDYSAANTKVLRMVNTLTVDNEAKQTIEALQTELQKTKQKLEVIEELKRQSADAGKSVDSYISGRLMQYKEQIATLEKREERYKAVFADRISVFRRACCELFGYKIVMDEHQRSNGIPATKFTLQSVYAQNDDEKLEFEYESGNTNIVANEYTAQPEICKQIDVFVRKLNSIPAFTANLTVESFNRRTFS